MNIAWSYLTDLERAQLLLLRPDVKSDYEKQTGKEGTNGNYRTRDTNQGRGRGKE